MATDFVPRAPVTWTQPDTPHDAGSWVRWMLSTHSSQEPKGLEEERDAQLSLPGYLCPPVMPLAWIARDLLPKGQD